MYIVENISEMSDMMKSTVLKSGLLVVVLFLFLASSLQVEAKGNSYARDYKKNKYTIYIHSEKISDTYKSRGNLNYLDYSERASAGSWIIGNGGIGTIKIKNSKTVLYNPVGEDSYKKIKVRTGYTVKTKAKTYKNCMRINLSNTIIYVAPKTGVVKYVQSGKTLFEMKRVTKK